MTNTFSLSARFCWLALTTYSRCKAICRPLTWVLGRTALWLCAAFALRASSCVYIYIAINFIGEPCVCMCNCCCRQKSAVFVFRIWSAGVDCFRVVAMWLWLRSCSVYSYQSFFLLILYCPPPELHFVLLLISICNCHIIHSFIRLFVCPQIFRCENPMIRFDLQI